MSEPSADELVRAARRGDRGALERLIEHCREPLRRDLERRAGAKVKRYTSISDLEQEVLARLGGLLERLEPSCTWNDLEGLLYTHARWVVQNTARRQLAFDGESEAGDPMHLQQANPARAPRPSRTGDVTFADESAWLHQRLGELPQDLQEVARLRLQDRSFAEIATELSLAENTVRRRFLSAARLLRPNDS